MMLLRTCLFSILLALSTGLAIGACSGGGGGSGSASTGSVAILITDGPTDEFAQILVTISRIELLGARSVDIFRGSETIDLLQLEDFSNLFAIAEDVPVGGYEKVRLRIDEIVLVRENDEEIRPRLPANGKIDLNPRETFFVTPGDLLLLEIDIDANKSIHIVGTGSGKYQFRPVVFIRVINDAEDMEKLARVHGVIDAFGADSLILCSEEIHTMDPGAGIPLIGCMLVNLFDDTSVFDTNGDPATLGDLMVGDPVTIVGTLHVLPDVVELDAIVIEAGPLGTFPRIAGEAASVVDLAERFELDVGAGQLLPLGTMIPVQLQMGTAILTRNGFSLEASEIGVGTPVNVDGVLRPDDLAPTEIAAAVVLVKLPELDLPRSSGAIAALDILARAFDLVGVGGVECVDVGLDAVILLVNDGGSIASATAVDLSDLANGQEADVYGEPDGACISAEAVIGFAP